MRWISGLSVMKVSMSMLACLVIVFDTPAFLFLMPYSTVLLKKKKKSQLFPAKSLSAWNCLVGNRVHRFLKSLGVSKCPSFSFCPFTSHFIPLTLAHISGKVFRCAMCWVGSARCGQRDSVDFTAVWQWLLELWHSK